MVRYVIKNNAESTVADNPLAQAATTLNVAAGEGANFPSTFPFLITLWDEVSYPDPSDDSGMEVIKCTGRTADALTIERAQEGTADVAHANGGRVAMLITAGILDAIVEGVGAITKTDNYNLTSADFGKSLRMNAATAKTFTFPSVGAAEDGVRLTLIKLGAGKLTLQMVDSDKILDSSAGGTMYCDVASEISSTATVEYCHATTTWNIVSASGTWTTT